MPSRSAKSWLYVSGAAVACAGVLIAGNLALHRTPPPVIVPAAEPVALAPAASRPPAAPPSAPPQDNSPIGPMIDTGITAKKGTWVLYLIGLDAKARPHAHFGVMLGRRLPGGKLTADVVTNEVDGKDTAPGFHGTEGSMVMDGGRTVVFGYYAGNAHRITATAHGRTVTAHVAASGWSGVQIFWFDAAVTTVSHLAAFDAHGSRLPAGDTGVAVG
jgi:hypothetical protein